MRTLFAGALLVVLATIGLTAVASAQGQPSTDGAARARSNAGSSAVTPTRAPAVKHAMSTKSSAVRHRLPSNVTGMGAQAANTTGATSNSH